MHFSSFFSQIWPVIALLLSILPTAYSQTEKQQPPNIVIVLADDQTYTDLGCYGNKDVSTPHIDQLAKEGMRFTRAFTATAMCAPSRQQLYTGLFPVRSGAYPNHFGVKRGIQSIAHHLQELGYRVGIYGKGHYGPPQSYPFEKIHEKEAIEKFMQRDKTQPFCFIFASHNPHGPWTEGNVSQFDPQKLTLPPYLPDTAKTRASLTKYYAEISALDKEVGQLRDLLGKIKRAENTLFLFTSEQGSSFPGCKWTCYETGLRVALIVRWPKRVEAGSLTQAMVQYVDIVPTLIDAAGGSTEEKNFDGKSFLPILFQEKKEHHPYVYGVHTTRGIISGSECYPIRSIRSERYKYILNLNAKTIFKNIITERNPDGYWSTWLEKAKTDPTTAALVKRYQNRPLEELYDLEADPYELHNLAEDPSKKEIKDTLHQALKEWMHQQGDKGIETEMAAPLRKWGRKKRNSPNK